VSPAALAAGPDSAVARLVMWDRAEAFPVMEAGEQVLRVWVVWDLDREW